MLDWLYPYEGDSDDEETALDFAETVGLPGSRYRTTKSANEKPRRRAPRNKTGQCLIWLQMLVTGRFTEGHIIIQPQHSRMWMCLWAGSGRYRKGPQNPHRIFLFSIWLISCCLLVHVML